MNCRGVVLCLNGSLVNLGGLYRCIPNTFCIDTFLSYTLYFAVVCSSGHFTIAFLPLHVICSIICNLPPIYIPLALVPVNNFRWHRILLLLYVTNMNRGMGDHKNDWKDQQDLWVWVNFFNMWNIKPSARPSHVQNCNWWQLWLLRKLSFYSIITVNRHAHFWPRKSNCIFHSM